MQNTLAKLILFLFLFLSSSSSAQLLSLIEDRVSCNFSIEEEGRFEDILDEDAVESVSLTTVDNPFDIAEEGLLNFEIEGLEAYISVQAVNIKFEDENNYSWSGNLINQGGHFVLVKHEGYVGGFIDIKGTAYYSIKPISTSASALVKYDLSSFIPPPFIDDFGEAGSENTTSSTDLCDQNNIDCFDQPKSIRMMVLVPDNVLNDLYDSSNSPVFAIIYIKFGVEAINLALSNSNISNVSFDWFLERTDFEFSPLDNIGVDVARLKGDPAIQQMRQDESADIVIMISNQNYANGRRKGRVAEIGPSKPNAYGIVELDALLAPSYTLVHEVGHLLGARHERAFDDEDNCCHAFDLGGNLVTVVHLLTGDGQGGTINSRSLEYSNAELGTGDANNNNALCIKNASCEVVNFFPSGFSVAILPPVTGCHDPELDNRFEAIVEPPSLPDLPGQPPYSYSWTWSLDGINKNTFGNGQISNLLPSEAEQASTVFIELTVTSISDGTTVVKSITSRKCDPPPVICPNLTATFTVDNLPNCPSGTNGSLTISPEGGTTPYTYAWSSNDNTASVDNLAVGTYTVTVTDANNCSGIFSYELQGASPLDLRPNIRDTDCGDSNGNIRLRPQGAPGPYSYQWSNSSTVKNQFGLSEGNYSVTVTDGNGCIVIGDYEIKQRNAPELDLAITDTNCNDDNGAIDLTITGGTAPYTIQWDNDCGPEDEEDIFDLAAGTYTVTVTDDRGCVVTALGVVEKSSRIRIVARTSEASFGQSDGNIDISVKGGTPPYEYDWDIDGTGDFDDPEDLNSVGAGTYTLVVQDATGCTKEEVVTIRNPKSGSISLESSVTTTDCNSGTNAILMSVTGGTAPYTYYWKELNDTQESQATSNDATYTIQNLGAGTYDLRVVDTENLEATDQAEVTDRGMEIVGVSANDATCGATSGIVSLTISGGTPPYVYSDGTNSYTSNNPYRTFSLPIGTYDLSATDANGCSVNTTGELYGSEADPLVLDQLEISGADCGSIFGGSSSGDGGKIHILLDGGTPSFSYTIQNQFTLSTETENSSSNVQIFGGLTAATYGITITDGEGCNITTTATVGSGEDNCFPDFCLSGNCDDTYDGLLAKGPSQAACSSGRDDLAHYCSGGGYININVTGGTAPYSYEWTRSGGGTTEVVATTEDLNTGMAGSYRVKVTDAASTLQELGPWNLYDPLSVSISCVPRNNNPNRFNVNANANGGSQCKAYTWFKDGVQVSDGDNDFSLKNQPSGTYEVLVEDVRTGCSISSTSVTCNNSASLPPQRISNFQTFTDLQVVAAPNPFQSHLNLDIAADREQTILIKIIDLKGVSVYEQKVTAVVGKQQIRIDLKRQTGVYQVLIIGEQQERKTFRVVQME